MFKILVALVVTVLVAYFVLKKYKPQAVLLAGGMALMLLASVFHTGTILEESAQTGFWLFDIFEYIKTVFAADAANLGLIIMSAGAYAIFMDKIGASTAMVNLCIKPLKKLNAPYLVLALSYIMGQLLNIFIPSAAGLGVLMMATVYPILVNLGVSPLSATAVIGTAACLDLGPASGQANMAAKTAEIEAMEYFVTYQVPVAVVVMTVISVLHFIVQKYFEVESNQHSDVPRIYAILPVIPLVLMFVFSKLVISSIKMNVVTAMLIGVTITIIFELFRHKGQTKEVLKSIQVFFDAMGSRFAQILTLIVAGEVFAKGLTAIGAIDIIIAACQNTGFGVIPMTIIMVAIISISAIIMGSGNAPFYAFAALAPTVAAAFGMPSVLMVMPMQLAAGIARSVSPITSCIVAVSEQAGLSSTEVVKRTAIPMAGAMIAMVVSTVLLF